MKIAIVVALFLGLITAQPTGLHFIKSVSTGNYWDVCTGAFTCDLNVNNYIVQNQFYGDPLQRFEIEEQIPGYYSFLAVPIGKYLAVTNGGAGLYLTDYYTMGDAQMWSIVPQGSGTYIIKPKNYPLKAITPEEFGIAFGLVAKDCTSTLQRFVFEVSNGDVNDPVDPQGTPR